MNISNENNIKAEVIALIKQLPEDATLDDNMYHLYVKQKILKGKEQIKEGKTYSHDQVKEMSKKRLK